MSFCPYCGNAAQDGAKFCRFCGKPIPAYPADSSSGRCSRCSGLLPSGAAFCMTCGAPAPKRQPAPDPQPRPEPTPQPKPAPAPKPAPKPKRKPHNAKQLLFNILMAAAALLALLGVVVGALYVTGNLGYVTDFVHDLTHPQPAVSPFAPNEALSVPVEAPAEAGPAPAEKVPELPGTPSAGEAPSESPDAPSNDSLPIDDSPDDEPLPAPDDEESPVLDSAGTLSAEEFEAELERIRDLYYEIESNRQAGIYDAYDPENGVVYYFSDGELIAVTVQPNVESSAYRRFYYYQDGTLFFAYYEGSDSYRFYFCQGRLIRLRYTPDTAVSNTAANYDQATTSAYLKWEERVLAEEAQLRLELSRLSAANESTSEYLLPDSDSRYLTEDDLAGFTAEQCRLARNEIYARHGRRFSDAALQRYFDSLSWYNGTIEPSDFNDNVFNSYERANCRLIVQYEQEHGYR